jgi:hypothetical protein
MAICGSRPAMSYPRKRRPTGPRRGGANRRLGSDPLSNRATARGRRIFRFMTFQSFASRKIFVSFSPIFNYFIM